MTRTLDEAIEKLRDLPEEEQDAAAMAIFAYISNDDRNEPFNVDELQSQQLTSSHLIH